MMSEGTKSAQRILCITCNRDPKRMNGDRGECSHVECPHRRNAWSERPSGHPYDGQPAPFFRRLPADDTEGGL